MPADTTREYMLNGVKIFDNAYEFGRTATFSQNAQEHILINWIEGYVEISVLFSAFFTK